ALLEAHRHHAPARLQPGARPTVRQPAPPPVSHLPHVFTTDRRTCEDARGRPASLTCLPPTTVGSMPGGVLTQTHHVRVAVGRQDSDATPTTGTIYLGGGGAKPEVRIRCEPVTPEGQ
ncbi:hypothetical protein, partial [Corallococcus exercitus]